MKWMKAVLCSVLLSTAGAAVSSDEVKEAPTDYATGVALETTGAFALVSHFAAAGGVSEHCMAGFAAAALHQGGIAGSGALPDRLFARCAGF